MQVWKYDDQELITTFGQATSVLSVNYKYSLLVFGLNGAPNRLQLAFLGASPQFVAIQQQRPAATCAYSNAALSADGNHLLTVCGPAEPYLELWSISPLQPLLVTNIDPQYHGTAGDAQFNCFDGSPACNSSLSAGCCLSFCPIGSLVACCVGERHAEALCFDKVLGQIIVRRKAIIAAGFERSELFTCHCWTPSGMLLLGTSTGRLLKAEGKQRKDQAAIP